MQNGCFCCTLQNDLVEQIKELAAKKMFNYMLIEASGVSEPSQIAPLFELCEDEHDPDNPDPDHEHSEGPELGEVARLDTCITVVDAAEFYNNLDSMRVSLKKFDYSSLLLIELWATKNLKRSLIKLLLHTTRVKNMAIRVVED